MLMQHAQRAAAVLGHDAVAGAELALGQQPRLHDHAPLAQRIVGGAFEHPDEADGITAPLDMAPLIARVRRLRSALGLGRFAASPLSAREARAPHLVAQGLTDRQIAEALVVSKRTAENHVQHILAKLGLDNRAQIAAWVATRPTAQIE